MFAQSLRHIYPDLIAALTLLIILAGGLAIKTDGPLQNRPAMADIV